MDKIYCAIAGCETEATCKTSEGTPLCNPCRDAYELGMANPEGSITELEVINEDN